MKRGTLAIGTAGLFVLLHFDAQPAWAQAEGFAKQGAYVGLITSPGTNIKGKDFDGGHYLYDADQIVVLPNLNSADGLGFTFGGRFERSAFEVSYVQAEHRATFGGARGMARSRVINLDGKRYFLASTRVQPYFAGGLAIPWLVIEDGSASRTAESDATLLGVGFNVGGGVSVYVHPRVAVSAGYNYRVLIFPRVKGATGSYTDIDDEFEPVSRNGNIGASVAFTF